MTNVADVYAAGDCALVKNRLTGESQWSPMGSSANMEGRTLALGGRDAVYPGVLAPAASLLYPEPGDGMTTGEGKESRRTEGRPETQPGEADRRKLDYLERCACITTRRKQR